MFKYNRISVDLISVDNVPLHLKADRCDHAVIRLPDGHLTVCPLVELVLDFNECISLLEWVRSNEWLTGMSFDEWLMKPTNGVSL